MPILGTEMKRRKGAVKGRESRNITLNTKLNRYRSCCCRCRCGHPKEKQLASGCAIWCMRELADGSQSIALPGFDGRNCGTPASAHQHT